MLYSKSKYWKIKALVNAYLNQIKTTLVLGIQNFVALLVILAFWDLDIFAKCLDLANCFSFLNFWLDILPPIISSSLATFTSAIKFSDKLDAIFSIKMNGPAILLKPSMNHQ